MNWLFSHRPSKFLSWNTMYMCVHLYLCLYINIRICVYKYDIIYLHLLNSAVSNTLQFSRSLLSVLFLVSIFALIGIFLCKQIKLMLANFSNKWIRWRHKGIHRIVGRHENEVGKWVETKNSWEARSTNSRSRSVAAPTGLCHWMNEMHIFLLSLHNDFSI